MNEMKVFENVEFGMIRTVTINDEPWFVGKDVADALGYINSSKAVITHVDREDKQFVMMNLADSQNGNVSIGKSKTAIINESGLYSLILSSKLPSAKQFKRWVTSEVLPSIRRTGTYVAKTENELSDKLGLEGKLEVMQVQINSMENMMETQVEKLNSVMENMTLSTRQQQKLYAAAKDRINFLLGGAHGAKYKAYSKSYFINLWNDLKLKYGCASYKDLNPIYYNEAFDFITVWEYTY